MQTRYTLDELISWVSLPLDAYILFDEVTFPKGAGTRIRAWFDKSYDGAKLTTEYIGPVLDRSRAKRLAYRLEKHRAALEKLLT